MLRLLYIGVILIAVLPTIPGISGVLLSAFGYIPPIGLTQFSFAGFTQVFSWEGVGTSIGITIFSALFSSYLACLITFAILQKCWATKVWQRIETSLSPLLAMPHVAFAIGFAFLFSPTGIIARLASTLFEGNDWVNQGAELSWLIKDQYGFGLALALAIKEVPFLLLMSIPILSQLRVEQVTKVSASLGYNRHQMWWKCVFPQWFSKMRFPMLAVIAYSLSVVDIALIIGPTNPPTFAVLVWQWFNDPDLNLLPRAAAGAVVLFILASVLITLARLIEWVVIRYWRSWQYSGRYGSSLPGGTFFLTVLGISALIVPVLAIWSVAHRWRFPDLVPSRFSERFWLIEWDNVLPTINDSLIIAFASATAALILALIAHEYRLKYRFALPGYIIAIPMLVPQLSVLFGLQVVSLVISSNSYLFWVIWSHVFFAFPFVYLALDGPWKSFDQSYIKAALSMGKSPLYAWLHIKLPILMSAVAFAWAVGMSVSLAQYLPTLVLGAGRVSTITTEAVALSSGFDRRVTAIYAIWQALLPLIFFSLAVTVSKLKRRPSTSIITSSTNNESLSKKPRHP
ncbi:thiamine ABC transporter permease [Vibrio sp. T187]|uniref:ABC transporter permease n=1 Tax=Vibrio TaxID=662 RepID=UPI0010C964A5|nr:MULTISPECIES: thiamine ABC transporter permease [Vibrio]MBW3694715.1 thiamine ABC transporter permease [Vibrio sp. T187]